MAIDVTRIAPRGFYRDQDPCYFFRKVLYDTRRKYYTSYEYAIREIDRYLAGMALTVDSRNRLRSDKKYIATFYPYDPKTAGKLGEILGRLYASQQKTPDGLIIPLQGKPFKNPFEKGIPTRIEK